MNLYDPQVLTPFLKRNGIRAEKSLGQHFLVSESTVESIVNALDGCEGVLEIGPGPGVLTGPVSLRFSRTVALEIDARFVTMLHESAPKADVRRIDALQADLGEILASLPEPRAIVSNLPYYITAPLIQRIADARSHFSRAVLMMQREVAGRIMAPAGDGERGSLSVYLQSQFEIERIAQVPASAFLPPPKVDSTVLRFVPRAHEVDAEVLALVRLGFAQPRKTLANNLSVGLHCDRDEVLDVIEALKFREKTRAQELTLDQWSALEAALKLAQVGAEKA